jgi:nucleotide-binding universal stress UspA family protein
VGPVFKTVVVPLDDSALAENALAAATAVARHCRAELLLVRAVDEHAVVSEAEAALRAIAERLGDVETDVACPRERDAATAIAAAAAASDDPLVCMSTHGRGGVGRALLGSVAEGVIQRHAGPVLLVGPHADIGALPLEGRIVACLDGSELAERILPLARQWAETFGMGLDLVQVVGPEVEDEMREAGVPPSDVSLGTYLARCGRPLYAAGVDVDWTVLRGRRPAAVIVEHVARQRPGLVALTTHGRTGLSRITAGSVAIAVVHDSPRPVLVHRPGELG